LDVFRCALGSAQSGQKQRCQDSNNGDDNQQFDECKCAIQGGRPALPGRGAGLQLPARSLHKPSKKHFKPTQCTYQSTAARRIDDPVARCGA
jgi:hypothetical protein